MIPRYAHPGITELWSDERKLKVWERVERAVIEARHKLGEIPEGVFDDICNILLNTPPDIEWWLARDTEIHHDLQAFVDERVRHLPIKRQHYFHDGMTSFDTEETAFLMLLRASCEYIFDACGGLEEVLKKLAVKYRCSPMMGVTHGQHAEIMTFGKRCLTWLQEISVAKKRIIQEYMALNKSKLSGAIGSYGGMSPQVEEAALKILGFEPFYGATQILPRQLFVPLASALATLVSVVSKIGIDIRLGARSPRPIYHEPFGKKQKGSSAMPHKKNPIRSEQFNGMARMAKGYMRMIMDNIETWEERAIEQSCVERVAWPDLFHVTMQSLTVCTKVLEGLTVYTEHMMQDVIDTRGTWASVAVKKFLREYLLPFGISAEDAYRITQLAAFNVHRPSPLAISIRENPPQSFEQADRMLDDVATQVFPQKYPSIDILIARAGLSVDPQLDATQEQVDKWNKTLMGLFSTNGTAEQSWMNIFCVENRLKSENLLFEKIFSA